jgi:hypothetical protein
VREVVLTDHVGRVGAGGPGELGMDTQGPQPVVLAHPVMQREGARLLGVELYRFAAQALTALAASALLGSSTETDRAATVARTVAVKIMVA